MAQNPIPSHKMIPGTGFIVDGFKYKSPQIKQYFLSHAHSDHYTGLRETWDYGLVHCNEMTGRLVVQIVGISPDIVRGHKMDQAIQIDGVEVIFVDANHCPGAAQILFRLPTGESYVHCGDMRFGPHLLENPHLNQFRGCNALFLDTTYCNAKYTFPPQEEAVEYVASVIENLVNLKDGKRRLFLIQTYVIGKERILIEVSRRTGKKLFLSERKLEIMKCIDMPGLDIDLIFTTNPDATNIHLTQWGWLGESWPFFRPNFKNMDTARKTMGVDEVIGFCPTGWMYEMKKSSYPIKTKGACSIHLVPYSEHSSYSELRTYVEFLKPHKVIPTVGVEGENSERNLRSMLKHFRNLVDEKASKASFLSAFTEKNKLDRNGSSHSSAMSDAVKLEVENRDSDAEMDTMGETLEARQFSRDVEDAALLLKEQSPGEEPEEAHGRDQMGIKQEQGNTQPNGGKEMPAIPAVKPPDKDLPDSSAGPHADAQGSEDCKLEEAVSLQDSQKLEKETAVKAEHEEQLETVLSILGSQISRETGLRLLTQAGGDLQAALNSFYEGTPPRAPRPSPQVKGAKRKAPVGKAAKTGSKSVGTDAKQKSIQSFFGLPKKQKTEPAPVKLEPDNDLPTGQVPITTEKVPDTTPATQSTRMDTRSPNISIEEAANNKAGEEEAVNNKDGEAVNSREEELLVPETTGKRKLVLPPMTLLSAKKTPKKSDTKSAETTLGGSRSAGSADNTDPQPQQPQPHQPPKKAPPAAVKDRSAEVAWDAVLKGVKEYDAVKMAIWENGSAAPYLHVGRALQAMDSTTKRLRISDVIANMFRSLLALSPEDMLPAAYLVTGKVAPDYEGIEMNVGGSIISQAVMEATGVTRQRLSQMYKELGDLGDVAQACRHNQSTLHKPAPLTIRGVFKAMKQIASEKGNGSALRKQRAVMGLLRSAREEEPRYIVRTLISNLRVGANWRSVIPGLARAFVYHDKGMSVSKAELDAASTLVTEAFHMCPNLELLIQALLDGGLEELHRRCTLKAGVPLKPMLAKICEGVADALRQLKGDFIAEFKYDGTRCQIHLLPNGSVKLFSRNCEDKTVAYPDVVEIVKTASAGGAKELVLDAELVAVDREDENRLRAFQELSTRARGQTEMHQVSVNVCVFVFDMLMVDGEPLLKSTLRERRSRVAAALPNMKEGFIQLAESIQLSSPTNPAPNNEAPQGNLEERDGEQSVESQINSYLLESFAAGVEGLMLKPLDTNATYQASKRSENWLKLKKDYCEGLRDSLDLVPIGAWWGQGRKTGWFSPFLMAAWDPEREEFQSVCRCMSGFTDVFYAEATKRLTERICPRKSYYNTGESCSVWFEPGEVWEIRGADLTISPVHKAAIGCIEANPERGVSLRFPRHIRVREDKSIEEATSPDVIVDLYNKQTRKMSSAKERLEAQKKRDNAEDALDSEVELKSEEDAEKDK